MVKKKVLVTGGSGYIGARICLYLANAGYSVTALCHSKIPSDENWVAKMDKVLIGDVRDEQFVLKVAEHGYDVLVHLISLDHRQSDGNPILVSSVNITPVWFLLDTFSKKGLKKFIYFSTAQVYGMLQDEIVTESKMLLSQNPYGLTHQIGEVICEYYNRTSDVDCHVVRLSNSYGAPIFEENNCWWLVINDLCRMAYTQKLIVLQSDGSPLRDFIHGWDVCRGVEAIIETKEKHLIYNLSSGITLSILEIAEKIKKVFAERYNIELPIKVTEQNKNSKTMIYKLDNSLICSIGFEPKLSLEDGINDLFEYLQKKVK
ncbi:NAD(P)-dependent oxidoreductase [Flavobacterium sp. F-65]|jgi:nucleoside-diphosphate-sugar epimerase|uniref:NAD(P)-dependent oxidoreductase n=1 Tax=Flavobacterium pisciphilum TaxID=2893755 RepID=A0ABS8MSJ3_9FLAO|nr:NAD(P)-dependent oxidoreductase [Flavobacterium sp. F-65]MCC9071721.1 NAD(P)-dependent oxidoreductase [Flavobacterium sp. F-65]